MFLKKKKFSIVGTSLNPSSTKLYNFDFTKRIALVMGNEHRGISDEAREYCDQFVMIPMKGMIQSLNVSVAAAVILYEALRQHLQ